MFGGGGGGGVLWLLEKKPPLKSFSNNICNDQP